MRSYRVLLVVMVLLALLLATRTVLAANKIYEVLDVGRRASWPWPLLNCMIREHTCRDIGGFVICDALCFYRRK